MNLLTPLASRLQNGGFVGGWEAGSLPAPRLGSCSQGWLSMSLQWAPSLPPPEAASVMLIGQAASWICSFPTNHAQNRWKRISWASPADVDFTAGGREWGQQTTQPLPTATWEATLVVQLSTLSPCERGGAWGGGSISAVVSLAARNSKYPSSLRFLARAPRGPLTLPEQSFGPPCIALLHKGLD